jgi:hypothetical protein
MLKQVTELSAKLVEADRLIDNIDDVTMQFLKGAIKNGSELALSIDFLVRQYRHGHPSTVPDENWNVLEQEEKEIIEQ